MADDDELTPLGRGINLNIGGGGSSVAGIIVPVAVLGIIGIGAYVLYRKFTEDCVSYDTIVGKTITCTKNEDCPPSGGVNYICKPCGPLAMFGMGTKKCVPCESTLATIANAFTGIGTLDSLSCMQSAGASTKPGFVTPGGTATTQLVAITAADRSAIGSGDISKLTQSSVYIPPTGTTAAQTCAKVITDCNDKSTTYGSTLAMTKLRAINEGSGATFMEVTCAPTTKDGGIAYKPLAMWQVPNGERISTDIDTTPYEFASKNGETLARLGFAEQCSVWDLSCLFATSTGQKGAGGCICPMTAGGIKV